MDSTGSDNSFGGPLSPVQKWAIFLRSWYQKLLDDSTPWLLSRWGFTGFLFFVYIFRVVYLGGWYIISYALGIYLLNLLIAFLSPQVDPEAEYESDGSSLPTNRDDEFKPFIRRLPEFKFWYVQKQIPEFSKSFVCIFLKMHSISLL
jgi:hypothetical protein